MFNLGRIFSRLFRNNDADTPETYCPPGLLNFEAVDDGWYPVATIGEHPHKAGLQICNEADAAALVEWADAQGEDWTGVPLYANPPHPKPGEDPPALGWAKRFRLLGNELQCAPEFGAEGRTRVIENREYKRVSVAWRCRQGADGWHPFQIDHIGLTNRPNMKGIRPWVNSEEPDEVQDEEPAAEPSIDAADILANGGPWWDEFVAKLNALISDAATLEEAHRVIQGTLEGIWNRQSKLEQLQGLLYGLANSAGVEVSHAEPATYDALTNAVDTLANRAAKAERDLASARSDLEAERLLTNAAIVDKFIALHRVDPEKRALAIQIVANSRDEAVAIWDAEAAPGSAAPQPPADPLAGRVLANASLGTPQKASPRDMERITADVRSRVEAGASAEEANAAAWAAFRAGTLTD